MRWSKRNNCAENDVQQAVDDPLSLGNLLLHSGTITRAQLIEAVRYKSENQEQFLGETMIKMGFISEEHMRIVLLRQKILRDSKPAARDVVNLAKLGAKHNERLGRKYDELQGIALSMTSDFGKA